MDRAYQAYFRQTLPARSVVEVAKLPRGALVEISAIAGR
jgi:enamine deaminase RidA (YjgF/YER057c/UK114 family)